MYVKNYIAGEYREAAGRGSLDFVNPAEGEILGKVVSSERHDVEMAVESAIEAVESWSSKSVEERHEVLSQIAKGIRENADDLAIAESRNTGKPLKLAQKVDIPRAATNFEFFANAITQFSSEMHDTPHRSAFNYTLREPLGTVGCISPWNLPLYLFSWKIAPAIAAGNTVVAKPSEVTPLTASMLCEIVTKAGLPPGVLNVVHGLGEKAGDAIVRHPKVAAISFTGSTKVGQHIASCAGPQFKKVSLEMGGKNPNIVFADSDFDEALESTVRSSFSNQGQICLCGSRILIEKSIYNRFVEALVEKTRALVVGHPMDPKTDVGAVVSKDHFEKISQHIDIARREGGRILCGGGPANVRGYENGFYIAPTIIEGLAPGCITNQEEIFGPVVTVAPFVDESEAIEMANSTRYGLSATVWTANLSRSHRMARALKAGIVWVNTWMLRDLRTPFGGYKQSGMGREGGWEALKFFTQPKNVCIKY